ncbi:MAG: thermonuclease family protein [Pseudomonadota bacterium]
MIARRTFLGCALAAAWTTPTRVLAGKATALSGDRFRIGDQDFQLADITAPSAYDLHNEAAPFFAQSKTVLARLISEREIVVEDVAPPTRWGLRRVLARFKGGPTSLQEALIKAGAARAAPQTENSDFITKILDAEKIARRRQKGLWALRAYRVFNADDAAGAVGGYNLVEGLVKSASLARGRFYLNFGSDFRTDFTVTAQAKYYRQWKKAGFSLDRLEGARLRVRGHVVFINGPSIEVVHPQQIEMIANAQTG